MSSQLAEAKSAAPVKTINHTLKLEIKDKKLVERFNQKVEYFTKKDRKIREDIITSHWEKGEFVAELLDSPDKYGKSTAEYFGQSIGYDVESVRAFHRLYKAFPDVKSLDPYIEMKVSWRDLNYTLSIQDHTKRKELLTNLVNGEISRQDMQETVKQLNKKTKVEAVKRGHKVDNRGGISPAVVFRSTTSMADGLTRKLDEVVEALREVNKMPDEAKRETLKLVVKDLRATVRTVRDKAEKLLNVLEGE
jgi:hypothetical protein